MRSRREGSGLVGPMRPLVQLIGLLRKELTELVRQPRLLLVLVAGPFLVLLLFAVGYDQQQVVLRTAFVGPDEPIYRTTLDDYAGELQAYITNEGYSTDVVAAQQRLADGDVDLLVVFPPDPADAILAGRQAVISVLHDKLDPIQQTAVEVSAEVAIAKLNATVLERVLAETQSTLVADDEGSDRAEVLSRELGVQLALDRVRVGDGSVATLDPAVLVRPFRSDAENILREPVGVSDFFAPSAIALLLQHMVLTFAALGLVSDRALGLFEVFRVAPIGAGRVLLGKYLAYTLLASAVGATLIAAVTLGLDVPLRGPVGWVAIGLVGMLVGSIGLGAVLSLLARTSTQAVQYAMLALLSGLFFGGFFLSLDSFRYPVRLLAWAMPVTYGVRLLRDVMLRGLEPASTDLVGIAATSITYALLAWALLGRRLRVR